MKTKLLKKIRKRYTIEQIDETSHSYDELTKFVYPIFILTDTEASEESFHRKKIYYKYEDAYDNLCKWIIESYGRDYRKENEKPKKVWWNNKQKIK